MISQELLNILACPSCKKPVVLEGVALTCVNGDCRRRYQVEDDIPIMLIDKAQTLSPEEWRASSAAKGK
ncbi:MAG: hypothetical protein NTX50_24375 [Candidatus Sumerlaeota bacterium]|nr:hypothetical protein [Candidatus Sumerlaeota bacterium]